MKKNALQTKLTEYGRLKNSIMGVLLLVTLLTFQSNARGQEFYDLENVNSIEITFAEADWQQILASYYDDGNDERLVGSAVINGAEFDSVGVRYKGNSSYFSVNGPKKPLNIKLDHIIDDQNIDGYGTIKLSNGFMDPSFVREILGYEIARKYTPASQANYANVYINDELIGLYSNIQSVDGLFLNNHFQSDDKAFFKGDISGVPGPGGGASNLIYRGPDSTAYYTSYEIKSDYGWGEMVNLCDTLNNYTQSVEDILNVDRALWHLAFHNVLLSLDSPINTPHNFYLYRADNQQFNYIFWDLNMTFGTYNRSGPGPGNEFTIQELQVLDPFHNMQNPQFPILEKLLANQDNRKKYIAHMRTILEENFANGWYETRAYELQDIIDDYVLADENKLYSFNDFLQNVENQTGNIPGIVQLMEVRTEFLLNHAAFANQPEIFQVNTSPEIIPPNSTLWITADVEDAYGVTLAFRHQRGDRFETINMYDDGEHNDGTANDGIFGTSLEVNTQDVQYYVYAQNNDAGVFAPARAAYEYYTIDVIDDLSDVVINEFLAINDAVVADQDGEFDDWVELYNTGGEDVPLLGCFLTDDETNLFRWAFPDTSIAAHDYLIIWVDDDQDQEGLHTTFNLSGAGESVILVDQNGDIIDAIDYGQQDTDISLGRYPNGTGPFLQMTPTFSAENVNGIVGVQERDTEIPGDISLSQNYPNPFNASTTIQYELRQAGQVKIQIINVLGEEVVTLVDTRATGGKHSIVWNGRDSFGQPVSSGVYLSVLQAREHQIVNKMTMMK
ncbi:MAG TPA: T9SS type A sorting domain-containing protein [Bacteroidetes bacterium]|nr:T9SS type A sorting domain-containing protein [Bacteroidota bacterium]HEX04709.1 T9SS type A sorting domain-containing protein [Bacteroidota bacterium]